MTKAPTKALAEKLEVSRRHARRIKAIGGGTEAALSHRERYERERALKTQAERELREIELAKLKGDLVSKSANSESLREILEQVKSAIYFECGDQLAVVNAGLSAEHQMENNRAAIARAFRSLDEWAVKNQPQK